MDLQQNWHVLKNKRTLYISFKVCGIYLDAGAFGEKTLLVHLCQSSSNSKPSFLERLLNVNDILNLACHHNVITYTY